ncbi:MAG: TIGR04552 family protein [Myxococcales bacterium]|nr:TIGR04552 family protein [Myxococcales bacterium]
MSPDDTVDVPASLIAAGMLPYGLQDIEQVRLVLRGDSVVDWQRLSFGDLAQVNECLIRVGLDPSNPLDAQRLVDVHRRSVEYFQTHYATELPAEVRRPHDVREVLLLASRPGPAQRAACTILKVMHIVHHAAGRELLYRLPVAINELFHRIEIEVFTAVDGMKEVGIQVAELAASRKSQDSIITKLLSRADSVAADVHDRLRFRVITETLEDLFAALVYMSRRLLPFNYVVPGESRNDLVDLPATMQRDPRLASLLPLLQPVAQSEDHIARANLFSASGFRMINFVVDFPVRIEEWADRILDFDAARSGQVVFLLVEFQLVDRETHQLNNTGDNRHSLYKERQRVRVFQRLVGQRRD